MKYSLLRTLLLSTAIACSASGAHAADTCSIQLSPSYSNNDLNIEGMAATLDGDPALVIPARYVYTQGLQFRAFLTTKVTLNGVTSEIYAGSLKIGTPVIDRNKSATPLDILRGINNARTNFAANALKLQEAANRNPEILYTANSAPGILYGTDNSLKTNALYARCAGIIKAKQAAEQAAEEAKAACSVNVKYYVPVNEDVIKYSIGGVVGGKTWGYVGRLAASQDDIKKLYTNSSSLAAATEVKSILENNSSLKATLGAEPVKNGVTYPSVKCDITKATYQHGSFDGGQARLTKEQEDKAAVDYAKQTCTMRIEYNQERNATGQGMMNYAVFAFIDGIRKPVTGTKSILIGLDYNRLADPLTGDTEMKDIVVRNLTNSGNINSIKQSTSFVHKNCNFNNAVYAYNGKKDAPTTPVSNAPRAGATCTTKVTYKPGGETEFSYTMSDNTAYVSKSSHTFGYRDEAPNAVNADLRLAVKLNASHAGNWTDVSAWQAVCGNGTISIVNNLPSRPALPNPPAPWTGPKCWVDVAYNVGFRTPNGSVIKAEGASLAGYDIWRDRIRTFVKIRLTKGEALTQAGGETITQRYFTTTTESTVVPSSNGNGIVFSYDDLSNNWRPIKSYIERNNLIQAVQGQIPCYANLNQIFYDNTIPLD